MGASTDVHLVDGTYELFRHYYGAPPAQDAGGVEMGAVIGVLSSMLSLLDEATHIGVATDHVIESFRNELWRGYKTGEGIDPPLLAQFHPLEDALRAMGVTVFAMIEFEADDALASAAAVAAADSRVDHVLICTPDKDLAQAVVGKRVIQFDRRMRQARDEAHQRQQVPSRTIVLGGRFHVAPEEEVVSRHFHSRVGRDRNFSFSVPRRGGTSL